MKVGNRPGVKWLIIVGAVVSALGLFSIVLPYVAGAAVAIFVGAALLVAGISEIVQSFSQATVGRKLGNFVLGVITAAAGAVAFAEPWLELALLTLLLSAVLVASGVWRIVAAWSFKDTSAWLALAFSGLIGIVLGVMIWMRWPESSLWAIGTLVGIDLLFTGISLIGLGMTLARGETTGARPGDPTPPTTPAV